MQGLKKIILARHCAVILAALMAAGCAQVSHLQELMTLSDFSREQEAQAQFAEEQDRKFALLVREIDSNKIDTHSRESILEYFGPPVLSSEVQAEDGQFLEKWLYRYTKDFSGKNKVYIYFDREGNIFKWERIQQ